MSLDLTDLSDVASVDHHIARVCQAWSAGTLASLFGVITLLGSGWMVLPMIACATRRGPLGDIARRLLVVVGVTSGLVAVLKLVVGRPRPFRAHADVLALVSRPSDYSLPSGHAAGAFAVAVFGACLLGPKHRIAQGALLGLAGLVALSRVVLGVHYPADVACGAALGGAIGWFFARDTKRRTLVQFSA